MCYEQGIMKLDAPAKAFYRPVSSSYASCLRTDAAASIDVELARRQHAAYAEALGNAGVELTALPAADELPDACFVEDTAVIFGDEAVLTIPGAASRQAETPEVAHALSCHLRVHAMTGAARLDGGDVLRVGQTLFVGLSGRTNEAGAAFLAGVAGAFGLETCYIPVPVSAALHLKSACSLIDNATVIVAAALAPAALFRALAARGIKILETPEVHGANVLPLGPRIVVSAAAPKTAQLLRSHGLQVVAVDVGEIHKGDGALTCLSLRIPRPGTYCA